MPQQSKTEPILSKSEFETFILIYAAHVDYIYSDSEINYILNKTDHTTYSKMLKMFNNMTDYASMKVILRHKKLYFKTNEDQNILFEKLKNIFEIDGEYSRIEKSFLQFFQRMTDE